MIKIIMDNGREYIVNDNRKNFISSIGMNGFIAISENASISTKHISIIEDIEETIQQGKLPENLIKAGDFKPNFDNNCPREVGEVNVTQSIISKVNMSIPDIKIK